MIVEVKLTADQIARATDVGHRRQELAVASGFVPRGGQTQLEAAADHILGACGELAVASWTGLLWHEGHQRPDEPDVGEDIEVKTVHEARFHLPVPYRKPQHWSYVLVSAEVAPTYRLRGWIFGHEARRNEWLRKYDQRRRDGVKPRRLTEEHWSYYVPPRIPPLRPIDSLGVVPITGWDELLDVITEHDVQVRIEDGRVHVTGWMPRLVKARLWEYFRTKVCPIVAKDLVA